MEEVGLIHGEINGANAGRRANDEVALLDWDQAGVGPLALEYGYPLIAAFVSEDLVVDHGSAGSFYAGYTDAGGQIDHDRLFDAALFHAFGTCGSVMSIGAGSGSCTPSSTRTS